ncbi:hypothetical protein BDY17DRAFT_294696 [Neohortaea acidophila]|uniref:Uncharacterized protein n=1 Tax=Neohortaea acidophila TaxID=245834 RepID=A0A6A6PVG0_9PEZI|nr:uncharacterized protein BDY17DRAFT_294696 [Neohortaea acidophila]KAF2483955.1 hypothetical protein BDY17DRAFT_294696 [Neohortaea acidophila]
MPPSTNDAPGRVPTSDSSANRARPEPPPSPLLKDDDETFGDTKWPNIKHFLSSHPDDSNEVTEESMKKIEEEVRELVKAMENGRRATPPRESQEDTSEGHVEGGSVERWAQRISSLRRYRRASTEVQKAKEVVQHKAPPKAARTKENLQPMQRHRSRKGSEPATSNVGDDGEESMSDNPKIRNYARTHENAFFGMGTLAYEKIWPAFPPPMRWSDKEGWTKGGHG